VAEPVAAGRSDGVGVDATRWDGPLGHELRALVRGAERVVRLEELAERLERARAAGRPLRVKLGLDPSAPDIHLGHTVVLRKLRDFQDHGHLAILVIGDFTGRIGDPSGRSEARRPLTAAEVEANAATYQRQLAKILDPERTVVRFNSEWLARLDLEAVLGLAGRVTVARLLERDDFASRFRAGRPIHLHEFFYPLLQAYDSVALEADVELGGSDQTFNLGMAREVQRAFGQEPEVAVLMPLLVGLDGVQKMSKSLGNYVGIDEPPDAMFGKLMSLPDELLEPYFVACTRVPEDEVRALLEGVRAGTVHPRDAKLRLAEEVVALYHGRTPAVAAREEFLRVFSRRAAPSEVPERDLAAGFAGNAVDLLTALGLVPSRSEARRLVVQGAVEVDGARVADPWAPVAVTDGVLVRVGKRAFCRVRLR
jgi:tyrosyl-tRNA synthetase